MLGISALRSKALIQSVLSNVDMYRSSRWSLISTGFFQLFLQVLVLEETRPVVRLKPPPVPLKVRQIPFKQLA